MYTNDPSAECFPCENLKVETRPGPTPLAFQESKKKPLFMSFTLVHRCVYSVLPDPAVYPLTSFAYQATRKPCVCTQSKVCRHDSNDCSPVTLSGK